MKKNISLILVTFIVFTFLSCNDSESRNQLILPETNEIVGELNMKSSISAPGYEAGFSFTLPESFQDTARVTVTAVSNDFSTTSKTITLLPGETSGASTIKMPTISGGVDSGSLNGYGVITNVKLSGLALVTRSLDDDGDEVFTPKGDNITLTSNIVPVAYFDRVQWPYSSSSISGQMTILLDWENPGDNDFDMYVTDANANVESAESGSRYETDIFNNSHPDGTYNVIVSPYNAAATEVSWKIFFVHPNQVDITSFEGKLTGLNIGEGVNSNVTVATLTKSTDADNVVSYTFEKL